MAVSTFADLVAHAGHEVAVSVYGAGVNAAVECTDCSVVLLDFDAVDDPGAVTAPGGVDGSGSDKGSVAKRQVTVSIDNVYTDGYSEVTTEVIDVTGHSNVGRSAWFEEHVWELTGVGRRGDACYFAEIVKADHDPSLVGAYFEWC